MEALGDSTPKRRRRMPALNGLRGLRRQIVLAVAGLVLSVMVATAIGSYVFYGVMFTYAPDAISDPSAWLPSGPEWVWIGSSTVIAVALAAAVAIKLSQRLVQPLTSVAENLRRISQGDLGARAAGLDTTVGEAALLVKDFNMMAERLERMAREQAFWNAAIAHELRTPVTVLRGRLQGLAEGVFEPDPKLFRTLLAQVEHLGSLIEDLRVVGLADSGHLTLRLAPCRLADEVRNVVALLGPDLRGAGLEPVLALNERSMACDAARIRQALLALLDNARCHAVPGRLAIALDCADGQACLSVSDDGPGIAPEAAARIFDAFQRGEPASTRAASGSGLGLAVVRAIAHAHGGHAAWRPSPAGGSTFELAWPVDGPTGSATFA